MISKQNRINRTDFETIMKKGGLTNSGLFSLRFLKNLPASDGLSPAGVEKYSQFAVVVSKKVAKTAVLRNKIRRRCYSILRKVSKSLNNSYYVILFAKKGAEKATFAETEAQILEILKKAKIC